MAQRFFNAVFQVPMAAVNRYKGTNTIPTFQQLSNQLRLNNPGELDCEILEMHDAKVAAKAKQYGIHSRRSTS